MHRASLGRAHAIERERALPRPVRRGAPDIEAAIQRVMRHRWVIPAGPPEPCQIVITSTRGNLLNIRCRCMTQTAAPAKALFYGYDPIGQASSLEEALQLWRDHKAERGRG